MSTPGQSLFVDKQLGTLILSHAQVDSPTATLRAAAWFNAISRFGIHLPLFVVRDVGLILTKAQGPGGWQLAARAADLRRVEPPPHVELLLEKYRELLKNIASSEVAAKISTWRARDDVVAVLLTRILGDTYHRWKDKSKSVGAHEMPLDISRYTETMPGEFANYFVRFDPKTLWGFLDHLTSQALHIYTRVELIDLDTIRLLGIFCDDFMTNSGAFSNALDVVDLFNALGSPEANDVANFSLELLPSVLETKRASGQQQLAVDGYASIVRRGTVDSLVLSELAHDPEVFEQKIVNEELLYFGHERQREEDRRLQYILVDSSASMRGQRQVFARGLALALVKKLSLEGDEIWLRFFDSRLHELIRVSKSGSFPVPYLLSFRSERGRNYGKVFRQIHLEITKLCREHRRQIVIYFITHGQCHISPDVVSGLAKLAFLYGIIILPSSDVELDYLPLLGRHQIVESAALESRANRRDRALNIVSDAGNTRRDLKIIESL